MTKAQQIAYRLRWLILIVGLLCVAAGIAWIVFFELRFWGVQSAGLAGTPAVWGAALAEWLGVPDVKVFADVDSHYLAASLFFFGILLMMQWLLLRPRRHWAIHLRKHTRPMKSSVVAAAFMGMLLTAGMVITLLEIPDWWTAIFDFDKADWRAWLAIWGAMAVVWAAWAVVFFIYWRQGDRYTQLGKMTRGLIAGSILELLVAIPVQAWATQQRDCYCARGSYTGLVAGARPDGDAPRAPP